MKSDFDSLKVICQAILLSLLVLMFGCKTTKTFTDKEESFTIEKENVLSVNKREDNQSLNQSVFTQWMEAWFAMSQQQSSEQETEQVQETITTTTDSTGAVTRTEQRTTNRSKASQFAQNASDWGQEYKCTMDSLSSRIAALELNFLGGSLEKASMSEASQTEKETESSFRIPFGWSILIVVLGVGVLLLFLRRFFP